MIRRFEWQEGDFLLVSKSKNKKSDSFADLRGSGPGRRAKEIQAVNTYQRKLESAYSSWADDLADDLADAEDDDAREEVLAAAVAALLLLLRRLGGGDP